MKVEKDKIIFSSGKEDYANRGIIGLSEPSEEGWVISEGYDGFIYDDCWEDAYDEKLTREEKIELADYMITLWLRFRTDVLVKTGSYNK